jgi:hypothetical protein
MPAEKLEPLHVRIGRLREQAPAETPKTPPVREQIDITQAIVLATRGKTGAERRAALRDLQVGKTITVEGTSEDTKTVTTKTTPRFSAMDDDELQEVNSNTLSSTDLDDYIAELERRTPERPAPPEGDADLDDLDLGEDDSVQPGFETLPWESYDPDHDPSNNGRQ